MRQRVYHLIERSLDRIDITVVLFVKKRSIVMKSEIKKKLNSFIRKTAKHMPPLIFGNRILF